MFPALVLAAAATAPAVLPRHALFGAALAAGKDAVTITRVIPGSAAASAGIIAGDQVESIDGTRTRSVAEFLAEIHRLHADQNVSVVLVRNGASQTLHVTLGRPQDEHDENVDTTYGQISVDGSLRRTLLTVPKGVAGRLPAVLVLGGIGCLSVDVASNPQDPYLRLTHDLSHNRFVTMRVEKSGVGDSQGTPCDQTDFASEERSYLAAYDALQANPLVDPARIFLVGHSIGSLHATLIAAQRNVAGIIAVGAVGRDWPEYETRNLRRQLELNGESPSAVDAALLGKQECLVRFLLEDQSEESIERDEPGCKEANGVYPASAGYMREVARVPVIDGWAKVRVPVLVIHGSSDFVTEKDDHERIAGVVNQHHSGSATFIELDGMDHLLYTAASPKAAYDAFEKGVVREYDEDFSKAVIAWLKNQVPKSA